MMKLPVLIWMAAAMVFIPCLKREDVLIVSAYEEKVLPGRQEAEPYYLYSIKLVAGRDAERMRFKNLWVDSLPCPVRVDHANPQQQGMDFEKGDTLLLTASFYSKSPAEKKDHRPDIHKGMQGLSFPILEYSVKKKAYFREIEFKKRPGKILR